MAEHRQLVVDILIVPDGVGTVVQIVVRRTFLTCTIQQPMIIATMPSISRDTLPVLDERQLLHLLAQQLSTLLHISLHMWIDILEISVVVSYVHVGDCTDSSHHVGRSICFLSFIHHYIHGHSH